MSEQNSRHAMQAFGMALLIEAAIVVVAGAILIGATAVKKLSAAVPITLATEEPEKQPEPEPPKPQPTPPQPKAKPQVKMLQPQAPRQQEVLPIAPDPAPVAAAATAFSEPTPPPPPPPPVPSGKIDPELEYAAKVNAAVRAVHYYPPAAKAIHFNGEVRVEFHLRDRVPSQIRVLQTCGVGFIDRMALQAVEAANYPEPPADLRGQDKVYSGWVEFTEFAR